MDSPLYNQLNGALSICEYQVKYRNDS